MWQITQSGTLSVALRADQEAQKTGVALNKCFIVNDFLESVRGFPKSNTIGQWVAIGLEGSNRSQFEPESDSNEKEQERTDRMATATLTMTRPMATGFRFSSDVQAKANSPYGLPIVDDMREFNLGDHSFFAGLSNGTMTELNRIKHTSSYPEGAVVLMEGQAPRGVYIVCQGRVKLMTTNSEGKTLIVKIAQPGEVLGLQSVVTEAPYELTAETLQPSQLAYIGREQFLRFLRTHGDACLRATQHLSGDCQSAYEVIRSIGLCHSVAGKLARLLNQWSSEARLRGRGGADEDGSDARRACAVDRIVARDRDANSRGLQAPRSG